MIKVVKILLMPCSGKFDHTECSDFLELFARFKGLYRKTFHESDSSMDFCSYAMFLNSSERGVRSFLMISRIFRDMAHEIFKMNLDQTVKD